MQTVLTSKQNLIVWLIHSVNFFNLEITFKFTILTSFLSLSNKSQRLKLI